MKLTLRTWWLPAAILFAPPIAVAQQPPAVAAAVSSEISSRDFANLVATLSEQGGFFDTDNLISNESSYLHVMGALERHGVRGGAYIGVGPDQNFSYIARIRPRLAFLLDIRRDNLLQHLMFKALFAQARNRAEYLALWLGKPVPRDVGQWGARDISDIVTWLDATARTRSSDSASRALVRAEVQRFGIPLSATDLATIERFHATFISAGLSLQFTSTGRAPRDYYPTLRQLVLERDLEGKDASYLATEADFQFVKNLQHSNRMVPVVGDLAGTHALRAIGQEMTRRGVRLSAIYSSNAEDYVMRGGGFQQYVRNVTALPRDARSVIIRSFFGGGGHPEAVAGYYSTQLLQTVDAFVADARAGGFTTYRELVRSNYLPLRKR